MKPVKYHICIHNHSISPPDRFKGDKDRFKSNSVTLKIKTNTDANQS